MLFDFKLNQIASEIHSIPQLDGITILFLDKGGNTRIVKKGNICVQNYYDFVIVIEDISWKTVRPPPTPSAETIKRNNDKALPELAGAVISCSQFGLSVTAISVFTIGSGGLGTVMALAASTSIITSGLQCANGISRFIETIRNPNSDSLENLDNDPLYKNFFAVVDLGNLASSIIQLGFAGREIIKILKNKNALKVADDKIPTKDEVHKAINALKNDNELKTAVLKSGLVSKASLNGTRQVYKRKTAVRILSEIEGLLSKKLKMISKDFIIGIAGVGFNAMPDGWVGSASGTLNNKINGKDLFMPFNQNVKVETLAVPSTQQQIAPSYIIHIVEQ